MLSREKTEEIIIFAVLEWKITDNDVPAYTEEHDAAETDESKGHNLVFCSM